MPTNLTSSSIKDTFTQLLHQDGGPTAVEKTVFSGAGVATALKVGTGSISVDSIQLDGSAIRTLDTNGDLVLSPNGTGTVRIASATITGGSIAGIADLTVADGGTGASDAAGARANLGLGTIATQAADAVAITGGAVNGTTVGATTAASVRGTVVTATTSLGYPVGTGGTVAQATSKATGVTLNNVCGQITMDGAQLNRQTGVSFTLTNSFIAATDVVLVNIASGATAGAYTATIEAVAAGSCNIHLHNHTPGTDLSEAVVLNFVVIKGAHS